MTKIEKQLIGLLVKHSKSREFTAMIFDRLKTETEKEEMIFFLSSNDGISKNDINYKALEIVAPRWGINVPPM